MEKGILFLKKLNVNYIEWVIKKGILRRKTYIISTGLVLVQGLLLLRPQFKICSMV